MLDLAKTSQQSNQLTQEVIGRHLVLTLKGCAADILDDDTKLKELTQAAAELTRATVLQVCSHRFSPQGVTVLVVLAESHASLHTYPEKDTVFWDCFTCGDTCDPELSVDMLVEALKPSSISKQIIFRS